MLDLTKRLKWDQKIVQAQVETDVQNSNTLIFRQTVTNDDIAGLGTRELVLKRFLFRCHGKLYVYTSSVPDSIVAGDTDANSQDSDDRLHVVFMIQCFWRTKTDVFINQI